MTITEISQPIYKYKSQQICFSVTLYIPQCYYWSLLLKYNKLVWTKEKC